MTNRNLSILIAEDDDTSSQFFDTVLKNIFHKIFFVRTGTDAVDMCRNNPEIGLILMDIKMPGMDGYEATREIRKFNREIAIIAQTAYAFAGDKKKAIDAGCDDYISKPINKTKLLEMIKHHLK